MRKVAGGTALLLAGVCLGALAAHAQDATWLGNNADFNDPTNWNPVSPPFGPTGTAIFDTSPTTNVGFSQATTTVGTFQFNPGAPLYTFLPCDCQILQFDVQGIVNLSGSTQQFISGGTINFLNSSTAGNATFTNSPPGRIDFRQTSSAANATINNFRFVEFFESATAGSATIANVNGNAVLRFFDSSNAGQANITNDDGSIDFRNTSSAGSASIDNNGNGTINFRNTTSAGNATINNNDFGFIRFIDTSSAANATINNNGQNQSEIRFADSSTAANATLNNSGLGFIEFRQNSTAGSAFITNNDDSRIEFIGQSSAGNATIINNGSQGTGFFNTSTAGNATIITNSGQTFFSNRSNGGNAQFITAAGAIVDFSETRGPNADGQISAGSIAGAGTYFIGGFNALTVGANNLSTEVSGTIVDFNACGCGTPGPGSLIKVGTGTLTLSGANTYSGGTTLAGGTVRAASNGAVSTGTVTMDGGTFQAGADNLTFSNAFALNAAGGTVDTNGNTLTLAGLIGNGNGAGVLTKIGAGMLILSSANTYGGGTVLNGGTLRVEQNQALGSGPLAILGSSLDYANGITIANTIDLQHDATLNVDAGTATQAGTIGQTGGPFGLTKTGTGTLILAGASTYLGATNVNAGTLRSGAVNMFSPSSAFNVAAGAVLDLNNFSQTIGSLAGAGNVALGAATLTAGGSNASTVFSGVIAGAGSLVKTGSGMLTLSGANTYSGGTTLAQGTLRLENSNALGTGALTTTGSVVDYANGVTIANAIIVNSNSTQLQVLAGSAIQSGAISELNGPRPLEKIGAGTLVLTAANTYTGTTTVSADTLAVAAGGSIAGPTTVGSGATLVVDGTAAGVTVNAGGTLGGTGTTGSATINGTLAPGNSIGTITIHGNLVLGTAAAYLVEVAPSAADRTLVTGGAQLAGTVQAVFAAGSYLTNRYLILSAGGGITGTFGTLSTTNLPAGFRPSLSYTDHDVILNLTGALDVSGRSRNQANVANALNGFFNNGGTLPPNFLTVFGLTGTALATTLTQLSGEVATGSERGAFKLTDQFLSLMLDPFVSGRAGAGWGSASSLTSFAPERPAIPDDIALAYSKIVKEPLYKAPPKASAFEPRIAVWGGGFGASGRTSGDLIIVGSHDVTALSGGFAAGMDFLLRPDMVGGFALSGGGTGWSLAQGLGSGKSDAFQAGLYGATRLGPINIGASFSFAQHWMSTDRFAPFGNHLAATFNAQSIGARVEAGYRIEAAFAAFTPYAALQAQSLRTPGYRETGVNGGFELAYAERTATDTRTELGMRIDKHILLVDNTRLLLRGKLAWAHDWVSDPTLVATFQALPGASFAVTGATPAKNAALVSAGPELRLASGVSLAGKFDGEFAGHSSTYAGTGALRVSW